MDVSSVNTGYRRHITSTCRVAITVNSYNSFCTIKNNHEVSQCSFEALGSKEKKAARKVLIIKGFTMRMR